MTTIKNHHIENPPSLNYLYFISFIEGGVVMVTELAGARLLAPFFGASLYSWASTLSITLLALMTGYYFGGYVTTKKHFKSPTAIIWLLLLSGLFVLLLPVISKSIMESTLHLSFFTGLIVSQMLFLFPPIFLMGMMSPMIIFQITHSVEQAGRSAGNIYAISTLGGILFTMGFGFGIIPNYGITLPLTVLGIFVVLLGLFFLIRRRIAVVKTVVVVFVIIISTWEAINHYTNPKELLHPSERLVKKSEGLMGEIRITDLRQRTPQGEPFYSRKLEVNNMLQNLVFKEYPTVSLTYYVTFIRSLIGQLPQNETALLIGLGGGSIYSDAKLYGTDIETVEIDQRIYDYGVKYFGMEDHPEKNTITDGRYFINTVDKQYDYIILDVVVGESAAGQLLTKESFRKLYQMLPENGTLIIEHGGIMDFSSNSLTPSIYKTLEAVGFNVSMYNPMQTKTFGDVVFIATKNDTFKKEAIFIAQDFLLRGGPMIDYEVSNSDFDETKAVVLTDDRNKTDILLRPHFISIRNSARQNLKTLTK